MTAPTRSLDALRLEIDRIDARIVDDLAARAALVREAFERKREDGMRLTDPAREEAILATSAALAQQRGLSASAVRAVFTAILRATRP
jgi:chorismate mutase